MRHAWLLAALAACLSGGCATVGAPAASSYLVRQDCGGLARCFTTIQAAVDASQKDTSPGPVTIDVGAGDFNEKVTIRRGNLTLAGKGRSRTRLHHALAAENARPFHRRGWGTPGSATLTIDADTVTIRNITVENDFDYLANDALPAGDRRKIDNSQAVALLLDIHSDRVLLEEVALVAYQDTLFANGGRAHVRNSLISGNVDFIFGDGQLLIENSELRSRRRSSRERDEGFQSFILAPSTQLSQPIGIVVYRSRLTREQGVSDGSVALARPWHPTTRFADGRYADPNAVGMALFIDCYMDAHIHEKHWASMPGTARDGTKTAIFRPQDSRFWESGSKGPGARRIDIGMRWKPAMGIAEIRRHFFPGWTVARHAPTALST